MTFDYNYSRDMFFHRPVSKTSLDETWATPKKFFEEISKEFTFDLDAAALQVSALCENWYGPDHPDETRRDAFLNDWCQDGKTIWLNPPYGRTMKQWLAKADLEASHGATVVCLIPARTDTHWWHDYCMKHEYRLIRGRLKFNDKKDDAPFASALVVMRQGVLHAKNPSELDLIKALQCLNNWHTSAVRFTQWILELEDEEGVLDRFQKVIFTDINNGCASSKFDALAWKKHFEEKHSETARRLIDLLTMAYAQYVLKAPEK